MDSNLAALILDEKVQVYAKYKVRCLRESLHLPRDHQEDILQEIQVELCRKVTEWDPERGSAWRTFARMIVDRRLANMAKDLTAKKRDYRKTCSLDGLNEMSEMDIGVPEQLADSSSPLVVEPEDTATNYRLDFQRFLATLPKHLAFLAKNMVRLNNRRLLEVLDVSASTLSRYKRLLRAAMIEAGFDAYFERSPPQAAQVLKGLAPQGSLVPGEDPEPRSPVVMADKKKKAANTAIAQTAPEQNQTPCVPTPRFSRWVHLATLPFINDVGPLNRPSSEKVTSISPTILTSLFGIKPSGPSAPRGQRLVHPSSLTPRFLGNRPSSMGLNLQGFKVSPLPKPDDRIINALGPSWPQSRMKSDPGWASHPAWFRTHHTQVGWTPLVRQREGPPTRYLKNRPTQINKESPMNPATFRYRFKPEACSETVQQCFQLALTAAGSLFGQTPLREEVSYVFYSETNTLAIHTKSENAKAFNKIFLGFLNCFLEPGSFAFSQKAPKSRRGRHRNRRKNRKQETTKVSA